MLLLFVQNHKRCINILNAYNEMILYILKYTKCNSATYYNLNVTNLNIYFTSDPSFPLNNLTSKKNYEHKNCHMFQKKNWNIFIHMNIFSLSTTIVCSIPLSHERNHSQHWCSVILTNENRTAVPLLPWTENPTIGTSLLPTSYVCS